jgi:demethylmenaquinone methyltransferase/2-methoxy-6-polyprenyl-1,4-benzoquinol methylase
MGKANKSSERTPMASISPHPPLRRYYGQPELRQDFINHLFNRTAYQYRNIDRATAFGSGLWYRRKALVRAGLKPGMQVLDVACGSGLVTECAHDLVGPSGSVIGLDPSIGMLREARKRTPMNFVRGLAERLPFGDDSFDFLCMGYALRHVPDLCATFTEYGRVMRPGGILFLLEISLPRSKVLLAFGRFFIMTVFGRLFASATGNREMQTLMDYWWDTTQTCVSPETIMGTLQDAGFVNCTLKELGHGLLRDYRATKP